MSSGKHRVPHVGFSLLEGDADQTEDALADLIPRHARTDSLDVFPTSQPET